jgi:hypothetical protein
MKAILVVASLAFLASCGADGGPMTPSAAVGLSVGTGGVSTGAAVGLSNNNVSLAVTR